MDYDPKTGDLIDLRGGVWEILSGPDEYGHYLCQRRDASSAAPSRLKIDVLRHAKLHVGA